MLALRYSVSLPRDYDMSRIRDRIRERGSALDDYEGLVFKAYCLTEAGVGGAITNSYAPFYVWANTSRMGRFLWGGDGFESFEATFGRPRIETWSVTSLHLNKEGLRSAASAEFVRTADAGTGTLAELADEHKTQAATAHKRKDTVGAVRGVDLRTGESIAFDALRAAPRDPSGVVYEVGHVSVPSA